MNTQVIPEQGAVADYVRRVREALADLPAEDVDDLVQGMEADLTEVAGEGSGTLTERLGSPEAYAAELRSAAGLPEAQAGSVSAVDGFWTAEKARLLGHREALVAAHPGLPALLARLAPLWWTARGAAIGWVVAAVVGAGAGILMVVGACLSIWWALRDGSTGRVGRAVSAAATALAIVVLVPMAFFLLQYSGGDGRDDPAYEAPYYTPGLSQDGQSITQLYAYDRDGKRLDDVRIYDQTGRPVMTSQDGTGEQWVDASGRQWANVYPGRTSEGQGWTVSPDSGAWHPPMAIAPLETRIPSTVDVLPNDAMAGTGAGDPAAPTEAVPSIPPTATATATTTPPTPSATVTTTLPTATTTRPAGTATTR